ncbi:MAG: ABC transporter permease [Anaerolineae bacterium]|nr:ABC transporter permease [Anaerolineae bacterium]
MTRYIIRRIFETLPVLIGASIVVFLLVHLIPGGPEVVLLGERGSETNVAELRARLGLDRPLYEQYLIYVGNILRGDLGRSVAGNIPIADELRQRFPATVELSLVALTIAVVVGVPLGIISSVQRGSWIDTGTMLGSLVGVSMPIFWLGLLLLWIFGVALGWLPFIGRLSPNVEIQTVTGLHMVDAVFTGNWSGLVDAFKHLILPSVTLSTIPIAIIARITRSAMLEVLHMDYIRTARAKGLRERTVILGHALRNAMLPVVTVIGLQLGSLLAGAVLTETIFSWPGIGRWLFNSIQGRDYAIVQSVTLVITFIFVVVNLIVDLSYAWLNPRIRYE